MSRNDWMIKLLVCAGLAGAFALTLSSASTAQTTARTLELGPAPLITVDNVNGPITVTGDGGSQVRFTADEDNPYHATDVKLEVTTTSNSLELYVNGPFRCQHDDICDHGDHEAADRVQFRFELHVPAGASVDLRTVNHGSVTVSGVRGGFRVRNVNGGIALDGMAGAGQATTVNGPVEAHFAANPGGDCSFRTVNGKISLYLPPGLNADLSYRTLNGGIYSDFAVAPLAGAAPTAEREGMRVIYRRGQATASRVGAGGPQLHLETVNGDIFLHEQKGGR